MAARAGCQAARQRRVLLRGCMKPRALRCEPQPGRALTFDAHPETWRVGRKRRNRLNRKRKQPGTHGTGGGARRRRLALCRNNYLLCPGLSNNLSKEGADAPGGTCNHF